MIFNRFLTGKYDSGDGSVVLPVETEVSHLVPWTRPNLTSEFSCGEAGGSRHNSGEEPWRAFDGNTDTKYFTLTGTAGQYLYWTLPYKITFVYGVSSVTIKCVRGASSSKYWRLYTDINHSDTLSTSSFTLSTGDNNVSTYGATTNTFMMYLADITPDYVGISEVIFNNVYVGEETGPVASTTITLLGEYSRNVNTMITSETGYKNDICLYETNSGYKTITLCKAGKLPKEAVKSVLKSTVPIYLNEDKSEVIKGEDGMAVTINKSGLEENFINSGCTITNKIASNFGYIKPNSFTMPTTNYGMTFKFSMNSTISGVQNIIGSYEEDYSNLFLNGSNVRFWTGSDTISSFNVSANTSYWVHSVYNGTNTAYYILTDNGYTLETLPAISSWTTLFTISGNTFANYTLSIGVNSFTGSIDLGQFIITDDNNQTLWKPYTITQDSIKVASGHKYADEFAGYFRLSSDLTKTPLQMAVHAEDFVSGEISNFKTTGNLTFNNKVVSGFSASNYLVLPYAFTPQSNIWDIEIAFSTGSNLSTDQGIFGGLGTSDGCTPFYHRSGNLVAYLSSNGTSWNIASSVIIMSLTTNTYYKMKCSFDGTSYKWYKYVDNSWNLIYTLNSSEVVYGGLSMQLGSNRGINNPFLGSIDLASTSIKINGETWWEPYFTAKTGYAHLIKPLTTSTTSVLTSMQNPTASYAGSVCTPLSLKKVVYLDSTLTNIIGSEDL